MTTSKAADRMTLEATTGNLAWSHSDYVESVHVQTHPILLMTSCARKKPDQCELENGHYTILNFKIVNEIGDLKPLFAYHRPYEKPVGTTKKHHGPRFKGSGLHILYWFETVTKYNQELRGGERPRWQLFQTRKVQRQTKRKRASAQRGEHVRLQNRSERWRTSVWYRTHKQASANSNRKNTKKKKGWAGVRWLACFVTAPFSSCCARSAGFVHGIEGPAPSKKNPRSKMAWVRSRVSRGSTTPAAESPFLIGGRTRKPTRGTDTRGANVLELRARSRCRYPP